jgi:HTH-type transcriptional regulator / antitoxin HigA
MGVTPIDRRRYAMLLAEALPRVIESDAELDRAVALLEKFDFAKRRLTVEQRTIQKLLAQLIQNYDDTRHALPRVEPREALAILMEQQGLRQTDLVSLVGSRGSISDILSGRRGISKAVAVRLAEHFHVSAELFLPTADNPRV